MPDVSIDPKLPLQVTVDFQSKHRAAFRLFTHGPHANDPWVFLKDGVEDTTAISAPLPAGSKIRYEFVFFKESFPFRTVLIFRQNGNVLPGGTLTVTGKGDEGFISGEVDLVI
jgi:hypothetical protein